MLYYVFVFVFFVFFNEKNHTNKGCFSSWPDPTCCDRDHLPEREPNDQVQHVLRYHRVFVRFLSTPQTLCATTTQGSDSTLTKDGLKFYKILPQPTCALATDVVFHPHRFGMLLGFGLSCRMATCKMFALYHRLNTSLTKETKSCSSFLKKLELHWAAGWVPGPQKNLEGCKPTRFLQVSDIYQGLKASI